MREHWIEKMLGDICHIVSGNTPKELKNISNNGSIPFYKISDMNLVGNERWMRNANIKLTHNEIAKLKVKIYPTGTIIFPKRGGAILTNKKRVLTTASAFDLNIMGILPNELLCDDYLYYWFISLDLSTIYDGSNVPQINNKNVNPLLIKIPPLPEQRTIVAKIEQLFSELDNGIANLKTAQEQLKVFRQAVLKKAFEEASILDKIQKTVLGDIVELISGNAFKKSEYSSEGVPLFQIANVSFNTINWDKRAFLPKHYLENDKLKHLVLKKDDIVMALNRPMLNNKLKISQLSKNDVPSILYQRVGKFILKKNLEPKYLLYYFQSPDFTKWLSIQLKGVNIPFINQTKLLAFDDFPMVDVELQKQIVQQIESRLSVCDKVEETITVNLQKAEALRQIILKKAFAGELLIEAEIAACKKEKDWEPAGELLKRIKADKL